MQGPYDGRPLVDRALDARARLGGEPERRRGCRSSAPTDRSRSTTTAARCRPRRPASRSLWFPVGVRRPDPEDVRAVGQRRARRMRRRPRARRRTRASPGRSSTRPSRQRSAVNPNDGVASFVGPDGPESIDNDGVPWFDREVLRRDGFVDAVAGPDPEGVVTLRQRNDRRVRPRAREVRGPPLIDRALDRGRTQVDRETEHRLGSSSAADGPESIDTTGAAHATVAIARTSPSASAAAEERAQKDRRAAWRLARRKHEKSTTPRTGSGVTLAQV